MAPRSVSSLEIWRAAISLVEDAYRSTRGWPREEVYGLTSQVRRAAISVPTNIAEGAGRGSPGEFARFIQIAVGSMYELDTLFEIAGRLGYAKTEEVRRLRAHLATLIRRTASFARYQEFRRASIGRP